MIKHFLQLAVLASLRLLKTKEACSCLCFSESGRSLFSFHPPLNSFFFLFLNVNRLVSCVFDQEAASWLRADRRRLPAHGGIISGNSWGSSLKVQS